MLIVSACIAGGMVYAGLKAFAPNLMRRKVTSLERPRSTAADADERDAAGEAAAQQFTLATVSTGLAISGALIYPPLGLASVPFTVYGSLPAFERVYVALFKEARLRFVVVYTTAVVWALATRSYIWAALLNWLYHYLRLMIYRLRAFSRIIGLELEHGLRQFMSQVYGAKPDSVWIMLDGVGVEIPFADLKPADVLVVNHGELIPIEGTIVEGEAEVCRLTPSHIGRVENKGPDDRVYSSTAVLSGKLSIHVDRLV